MKLFGKEKNENDKPSVVADVKSESKSVAPASKVDKKVEVKKADKKVDSKLHGSSVMAYQVLLKPLITEKATELLALSKYVFSIDPTMNKVEVKKAIRTIYKVDPKSVNILNFSGKQVRYGKTSGKTKKWKKAIVTLKAGDSIQVYEGV